MEYNNIQEFCYAMWAATPESSRDIQTSNVRVADAANDQTSKSNHHVAKSQSLILYFNSHIALAVSMTYIYAFVPIIYQSA